MGWLGFGKKDPPKVREISSIKELDAEDRAEIDEQTAQGHKAADIARRLNLDVGVVYEYRRSRTIKETSDPLRDAERDLRAQKVKLEIQAIQQDMDLRKAEHDARMQELQGDDEPDGDIDAMLVQLLGGTLMGRGAGFIGPQQHNQTPTSTAPPAPMQETHDGKPIPSSGPAHHYTDEELNKLIGSIPKAQRNMAKVTPEPTLRDLIKRYDPLLDEDTTQRAIQLLR